MALKAEIENWRWAGVPFYLRTGKRLPSRVSEIVVTFKPIPHSIFGTAQAGPIAPNRLVIRLQPDEGVKLWLMIKDPGPGGMRLSHVPLDMSFAEAFDVRNPDAYERLLMDVVRGNQTLFMRRDEVEAAWAWIDPILEAWAASADLPKPYTAGTWGPSAAVALIERDGRTWYEDQDLDRSRTHFRRPRGAGREPGPRRGRRAGARHRGQGQGDPGRFGRHDAQDCSSRSCRRSTLPWQSRDGDAGRRAPGARDERALQCATGARDICWQNRAAAAKFVPLVDNPDAAQPCRPSTSPCSAWAADGHTASFFPGGDRLAEAIEQQYPGQRIIAMTAPGAGEPRLTFTLPVLEATGRLTLHIEGAEKKEVLARPWPMVRPRTCRCGPSCAARHP